MELGRAAAGKYNGLGVLVRHQDNGTLVNPLEIELFIWHHSGLCFGAVMSQQAETREFILLGRVTNSVSQPLDIY